MSRTAVEKSSSQFRARNGFALVVVEQAHDTGRFPAVCGGRFIAVSAPLMRSMGAL
jgi:hypothetical protein